MAERKKEDCLPQKNDNLSDAGFSKKWNDNETESSKDEKILYPVTLFLNTKV